VLRSYDARPSVSRTRAILYRSLPKNTSSVIPLFLVNRGIMSSHSFNWEQLLSEVGKKIPPAQFRAWLDPVRFLELTSESLVVTAPTPFSKDWITDNYKTIFEEALLSLYGVHASLKVEVDSEMGLISTTDVNAENDSNHIVKSGEGTKHLHEESELSSEIETPQSNEASTNPGLPLFEYIKSSKTSEPRIHTRYQEERPASNTPVAAISVRDLTTPVVRTQGQSLDPKQTFDRFVVGASNQFAHAAARAVAEQPASQYNPLFIYSGAGLGKTHLLHAIGNYVLKVNPKAKICYLSAEKFVNDLIDSIRHEKMSQFRSKYRDGFDMLLMDDIQFIAGKDRTQEEFFHTFNALHSSKRQIVVTSDKFPKDIPGLEERLRTRFEWGLVADIQPPEIETRIAILKAKAEIDDIFLPNDVAVFLASHIKTNVRELEGALIRMGAQASLSGVEISLELAKRELKTIIQEPSLLITPDVILDAVASHFSIRLADLKGSVRSRKVALPRQIGMFLIRKYCTHSFTEIGLLFGGKDHSTVMHGVRSVEKSLLSDAEIRGHVESIQNSL